MYPGLDGIQYDPHSEIVCPKCYRKGRVRRRLDTRITIEHTCPGPWTLVSVVPEYGATLGAWRAIFHGFTPEQARAFGWDRLHTEESSPLG